MKQPPDPPPPPSFERPSDDPCGDLTDEDLEWLEQAEREGKLWTEEQYAAELENFRQRFRERLRRAGFDPDEPVKGEK